MAQDLRNIKELLTTATGTQGTLLIPRKIYDTIIDEAAKALIPRSEAGWYFGPGDIPGSSIDLNLMSENTLATRLVAEAGEIPIDAVAYTNQNIRPLKYGLAVRITRELLEDSKWNLLQHNLMIAGRRFAERENRLWVAALDGGANTVSGGAAVSVPNIVRAMQFLEDAGDKTPTTYAVGMEVLADLRTTDLFTDFQRIGNTDMLTKGFLGNIFAMNVMKVSTQAGMTATTSYIFDRNFAVAIAEKRAITVENFELPTYDMSGAVVTQRIAIAAVRTNAIAIITSS